MSSIHSTNELAYYDSLRNGLIPCKVIKINPETLTTPKTLLVMITANRGPFVRGEVMEKNPAHIIPRKHVHVRGGQYVISYSFAWFDVDR